MKHTPFMTFVTDKENKTIRVEREFAAPLETVWAAWTESNILDRWWAPKPWQARTKTMQFSEGGYWLYAMEGPQGERHWSRFDFKRIQAPELFAGQASFCDENGTVNTEMPPSNWSNRFEAKGNRTHVHVEITFNELTDLEKLIEMGFQGGFAMGMENLDGLLEEKTL